MLKKNNNYYIKFAGSPSLTKKQFYELLNYWVKNNIHNINGTSLDDMGWYYAAPDTAVIIDKNAINYKFIASKTIGHSIEIIPEQTDNFLKIINKTITVTPDYAEKHCKINISIRNNNQVKIYGCMAQTDNPKSEKPAIPNPVLYAKNLIAEFLKINNINLQGKLKVGKTPENAKQLSLIHADDLFTMIKYMLQKSDNIYASSITKQLGYAATREGSNKQGVFAIKETLKNIT